MRADRDRYVQALMPEIDRILTQTVYLLPSIASMYSLNSDVKNSNVLKGMITLTISFIMKSYLGQIASRKELS